jgi:hypothetical protein
MVTGKVTGMTGRMHITIYLGGQDKMMLLQNKVQLKEL